MIEQDTVRAAQGENSVEKNTAVAQMTHAVAGNAPEEKNRVVVLSRNYSTALGVIRSLGAAGYAVDLVASAHKAKASAIAAASKYVDHAVEIVSKKSGRAAYRIVEELLKYQGKYERKPLLFPSDDFTASAIDRYRDQLEDIFILPTVEGGGNECMLRLMDKTTQSELARTAGIQTPREWIIQLGEENIEIPADMVYPCFVKPLESVNGFKKEMRACENEEELRNHLNRLRKANPDRGVLVQEFLNIEAEIDLSGVCYGREVIIPAIIRKTHIAQHERGVTLAGVLEPPSYLGELQDKVLSMMSSYGYYGMFDLELIYANDQYYFNEVNLRSGGPSFSYFMSGANLPGLVADLSFGKQVNMQDCRVPVYGKSFVYEKVAWEDYLHGYLTRDELTHLLHDSDITLLQNEDDPLPGRLFMIAIVRNAVRQRTRTAKRVAKGQIKQYVERADCALHGFPQARTENQRSASEEKPRVLVVGRSMTANLCAARAFGKAGYAVEVIRVYHRDPHAWNQMALAKPAMRSQYVKAYYLCVCKGYTGAIFRKILSVRNKDAKMILVPTDALCARAIDRHREELAPYYLLQGFAENPGAAEGFTRDGEGLSSFAEALGIEMLSGELHDDGYRRLILPGVCAGGLACIPAVAEECAELGGFDVSASRGCCGTFRAPAVALADKCANALVETGYEGLFHIIALVDDSGAVYLRSVRFFAVASAYALVGKGINMCAAWADYASQGAPLALPVLQTGECVTFVDERKVSTLLREEGRRRSELEEIVAQADATLIRDEQDFAPGEEFNRSVAASWYVAPALESARSAMKTARVAKRVTVRAVRPLKWMALGYPQYKKENRRGNRTTKPRVLVTGRNYCSNLCIAKAVGRAGYEVEVLRIHQVKPKYYKRLARMRPALHSKYVKAYYICVSKRNAKNIVRKLIEIADPERKNILIPADDLLAGVVDMYYDCLSAYYILPSVGGTGGGVLALMDKGLQKELARSFGLPVANGCTIRSKDGEFTIPETVTYPCFAKPNVSKDAAKSRLHRCENEEELRRHIGKYARRADVEMLVEDYLEIEREYSLLGVSTAAGAIGPAFFVSEEGGSAEHQGVAALGRILPVSEMQELIDRSVAFVSSLGFEGLYDIDYIQTPDGSLYFAEINMRFGASGCAFVDCGVNLPGMYADYCAFGTPLDLGCTVEDTNHAFVSEKVLLDEYANGRMTKGQVDSVMGRADIHFINDPDDPAPWKSYKVAFDIAKVKRGVVKSKKFARKIKRSAAKGKRIARKIKRKL